MARPTLALALNAYEHALDALTGRVTPDGFDINWLRLHGGDAGRRLANGEIDAGEMTLAEVAARRADGDDSVLALPVFLSRGFAHTALWVRNGGPVTSWGDLAATGLRMATDDATAAVYLRAALQVETGAAPTAPPLPRATTADLFRDLAAGGLDAALSLAGPPAGCSDTIVPLTADPAAAEHAYFRATGIFPVFRVLCLRRAVAERHPWLSAALFDVFERAKNASLGRLIGAGMSRYPLPWLNAYVTDMRAVYGDDFWPYGEAANRATLQAFLDHAAAEAVTPRPLSLHHLFEKF